MAKIAFPSEPIGPQAFSKVLSRSVAVPFALLAALAAILIWLITVLVSSARLVSESDWVIMQSYDARQDLVDMEAGIRGYLLTADRHFLDAYEVARMRAGPALSGLNELIETEASSRRDAQRNAERVRSLIHRLQGYIAYADRAITERSAGLPVFVATVSEGRARIEELRNDLNKLIDDERVLREARERRASRDTALSIGGGALLAALIGCVLATFSRRQLQLISGSYRSALRDRERQIGELASGGDRLREALAARDEFLAVASHELKTPLTSIKLQIQGLKRAFSKTELNDDSGRFIGLLTNADRQISRLAHLIEELLEVTRLNAGQMRMRRERFDFVELVREVVESEREAAARNGSAIELRLQGAAHCEADRGRIAEVISNLISNAIRYGAGNRIEVAARREGDRAVLIVEDHGIGIASHDRERIFDRFERAVSARHFGGLGLGLYLVRKILEAHGGAIRVHSEVSRGSVFRVELPLTQSSSGSLTQESEEGVEAINERTDAIRKLREMIQGVRVAMLTTAVGPQTMRSRPMAVLNQEFDGDLWFFTDRRSPKVEEIRKDGHVCVAYVNEGDHRFVSVSGRAEVVDDSVKARSLWSPAARVWFPDGVDDPNLLLIKVAVEHAEYWDSKSRLMVEIAGFVKSVVTGERPDAGENRKLDLTA